MSSRSSCHGLSSMRERSFPFADSDVGCTAPPDGAVPPGGNGARPPTALQRDVRRRARRYACFRASRPRDQ